MNATQCRMARAALGLGLREFADLAGVSVDTIARLQRGEELKDATIQRIRAALEKAGVVFIDDNGGGVKLRK